MLKKALTLSLVGLLILGLGSVVFAAPAGLLGQNGANRTENPNWEPPITKIDLSEEQQVKLRDICEKYFVKMQDLKNELAQKKYELKNLYLQKDPDKTAIENKQKEIAILMEQIKKIREEKFNEQNKVLTKEQQEKLSELRQSGKGKRQGDRNGSMQGGKGLGICTGNAERAGLGQGMGLGNNK